MDHHSLRPSASYRRRKEEDQRWWTVGGGGARAGVDRAPNPTRFEVYQSATYLVGFSADYGGSVDLRAEFLSLITIHPLKEESRRQHRSRSATAA